MKSVLVLFWLAALGSLSGLLACSSGKDVPRVELEVSEDPAGQWTTVRENALHTIHLSGTTPLSCVSCHQLQGDAFDVPTRAVCTGCHQDNQQALHGQGLECTECHAFAAGRDTVKSDCQRCHKDSQAPHRAIKAHGKVDCQNCHVPHGSPKLAVRNCLDCHEDHQQNHGKKGQGTIERCSECHAPHSKSLEAVTLCQNCHQDKLVRAVFRGHDKCETCHQGDTQSAPSKPMACTSCHNDRLTLAAPSVTAHAKCENCHAPHDPRGTAIQSCRRCHDEVVSKHPVQGRAGSCLGCHPAHPKRVMAVAVTCSSCHREARTDTMLHAPNKTSCTQCHSPHQFEPPSCSSCHQEQLAETRPAPGHKDCASCHSNAHTPKAAANTCASCHAAEYETAPLGHKACATCHQPHSGARLTGSQCASCHKEKVDQTHGRIAGGCQSCHRAHGPKGKAKPPSCASCHDRKQLPALHAVVAHDDCKNCHQGHGMRELNRATCLTGCHASQVDHEPVAKTCVGCHPFGASR